MKNRKTNQTKKSGKKSRKIVGGIRRTQPAGLEPDPAPDQPRAGSRTSYIIAILHYSFSIRHRASARWACLGGLLSLDFGSHKLRPRQRPSLAPTPPILSDQKNPYGRLSPAKIPSKMEANLGSQKLIFEDQVDLNFADDLALIFR